MTEQTLGSTPPSTPDGIDWSEIYESVVNWLPDQILAPLITPWTPDHLRQAMSAARRAYFEVLQGLRRRENGNNEAPINVPLRATDGTNNAGFQTVVAEIAGKRLNARAGYPHTIIIDLLEGHGCSEAEEYLKRKNIKIETAPPVESGDAAAATAIASRMAVLIRRAEGESPEKEIILHTSGRFGWQWYWGTMTREKDSKNSALEPVVKNILAEKHKITIREARQPKD